MIWVTILPMAVRKQSENRYLAAYKPSGILSTFTDPENRRTLKEFIPIEGVYAAGRLDYKSEGLLLLTDDGGVIKRLSDPAGGFLKTYYVQVEGVVTQAAVDQLCRGVVLRERATRRGREEKVEKKFRSKSAELISEPGLPPPQTPVRSYHPSSWLKIVLEEGHKHHIRRMTASAGFPTLRLVRIAIGPVQLASLQPGEWRWLAEDEIRQLISIPESLFREFHE